MTSLDAASGPGLVKVSRGTWSAKVGAHHDRLLRRVILMLAMTSGAVIMLFPFYWLVIASTHTSTDMFTNPPKLAPGSSFMDNVVGLFRDQVFGPAVINSIVVSVLYAALGGFVCMLSGYAFGKFTFRGSGLLFGIVLVTMAVPGQITIIPLFKMMTNLGWLNSYASLILPNLAMPFGIFLMRQMMRSVPDELMGAGRIDGCGEFRLLFSVVLPTMRPAIAALVIYMFLDQWNSFLWPLVAMREQTAYTIPVALSAMQGLGTTNYGQMLTGAAISVILVAIIFITMQRQFVAGMMAGAVKE